MTQKITTETFRSVFKSIDKNVLQWFPGHMNKGLKQMQHKLRSVDCIIEVHDARIPISGRNTDFKYKISGVKPHILVLNKEDLIENKFKEKINDKLRNEFSHIVYTNCKNQRCNGVSKLFPLAQELIHNSDRYNRSHEQDYCIMIIGIPNVGKSSLVNALRVKHLGRGNATQVGAAPGITRSVLHKIKMCEQPLFYMLDTPGILTPSVQSTEVGLKLALCATIQDHLVGEEIVADYLLFSLNQQKHFQYVRYFGMEQATDNILEVLTHIAVTGQKMLKMRNSLNQYVLKPDLNLGAKLMIKAFREGNLGRIMLDENVL